MENLIYNLKLNIGALRPFLISVVFSKIFRARALRVGTHESRQPDSLLGRDGLGSVRRKIFRKSRKAKAALNFFLFLFFVSRQKKEKENADLVKLLNNYLVNYRFLYVLFLLFFTTTVSAQIIDNRDGTAFTDDNFFSSEFIKRNKIKSIKGKVSTKRDNEAMYEKDQFNYYEFDANGRITVIMSTFTSLGNSKDTGVVTFNYDAKGQLITKRRNDNYGFYSYNYEYDSIGRVIKETYCRDENAGTDKYHFVLGKQFIISSETFTYHQYVAKQFVRKYFNNYGALYQERYAYYDANNYHTEDIYRLTLSGKESKTLYSYDEKGRLNKKSDVSYIFGYSETTDTYKYDVLGNLEEHAGFRNSQQKVLRSLLYDQKTMLLSAQVMKDFDTELIYVVKYSYSYF